MPQDISCQLNGLGNVLIAQELALNPKPKSNFNHSQTIPVMSTHIIHNLYTLPVTAMVFS